MSKYIFNNDSVSFLVTQGRVESKITATCVFLKDDLKCLIKVDVVCQRSEKDTIEVTSISLQPRGYFSSDFQSYMKGYFCLPASMTLRQALENIATSSFRNADCFALLTADLPDKWVEFARELYHWIVERIIPVVQKEIEIHQTFFGDKKAQ